MKSIATKSFLIVVGLCLWGGHALAQGKVVTIDYERVFTNYYKTKQANAAIKDHANDLEKEFNTLRTNLDQAQIEYRKLLDAANDQVVSPEEREKRKVAADAKKKEMQDINDTAVDFKRRAEITMREQRHRMRDKILEEIHTALIAKAKAAGYALVIDTSAKGANGTLELISMVLGQANPADIEDELARTSPVVLYTSGENDITDALIKQLNAAEPAESSKPPDKADEKKK